MTKKKKIIIEADEKYATWLFKHLQKEHPKTKRAMKLV